MDLTTSGLAGVNEKFNNILKKVDSVADTMKAQIQGDASAAAAAIGGDLSSLTGELRSLIPQGAALPNINLQSQLSSLVSISNPAQAANLLSNITSTLVQNYLQLDLIWILLFLIQKLLLLVVRVCLSVFLILKNQQMEYPLHFKKLLQLKYPIRYC